MALRSIESDCYVLIDLFNCFVDHQSLDAAARTACIVDIFNILLEVTLLHEVIKFDRVWSHLWLDMLVNFLNYVNLPENIVYVPFSVGARDWRPLSTAFLWLRFGRWSVMSDRRLSKIVHENLARDQWLIAIFFSFLLIGPEGAWKLLDFLGRSTMHGRGRRRTCCCIWTWSTTWRCLTGLGVKGWIGLAHRYDILLK